MAGYDRECLFAMTDGAHGGPVMWSYVQNINDPSPCEPGFFDGSPLRVGDFVLLTQGDMDADDGSRLAFGALRIVHRVRPQVVLGILGG